MLFVELDPRYMWEGSAVFDNIYIRVHMFVLILNGFGFGLVWVDLRTCVYFGGLFLVFVYGDGTDLLTIQSMHDYFLHDI